MTQPAQQWIISINGNELMYVSSGQQIEIGRKPIRPLPDNGVMRLEVSDDSRSMSKRHALLRVTDEGDAVIRDLHSTNGTYMVGSADALMRLSADVDFTLPTSPVRMQFGDSVVADFIRVVTAPQKPAVAGLFTYAHEPAKHEPSARDMSVDDILDLRAGEPTSVFTVHRQAGAHRVEPLIAQQIDGQESQRQTSDNDNAYGKNVQEINVQAASVEQPQQLVQLDAQLQRALGDEQTGIELANNTDVDNEQRSAVQDGDEHHSVLQNDSEPSIGTAIDGISSDNAHNDDQNNTVQNSGTQSNTEPADIAQQRTDNSDSLQPSQSLPESHTVQPAHELSASDQSLNDFAPTSSEQQFVQALRDQEGNGIQALPVTPQVTFSPEESSTHTIQSLLMADDDHHPIHSISLDTRFEQQEELPMRDLFSDAQDQQARLRQQASASVPLETIVQAAQQQSTLFAASNDANTLQSPNQPEEVQIGTHTQMHVQADLSHDDQSRLRDEHTQSNDHRAYMYAARTQQTPATAETYEPVFEPGSVFARVASGAFDKHEEMVEVAGFTSHQAQRTTDYAEQFEMSKHEQLRPYLAMNPALYDDLYGWLSALGEHDVDAALAHNTGFARYAKARKK